MRDDIFLYLIPLPHNIHEMVCPCLDGYTVYIDSNLSQEKRLEAYEHALQHIENDDFEKYDVNAIERDAHS